MSDITEMHIHRFLDVDFRKIRAEAPDQGHRVVIGSVRRSEARHRDGVDTFVRNAQHIEGSRCDEKCQGGVESAGDSYNRALGTGVGETFL